MMTYNVVPLVGRRRSGVDVRVGVRMGMAGWQCLNVSVQVVKLHS